MSSNISNKEEDNENNNNDSEEINLIDNLDQNCDFEKLKEINIKCVDLIFDDKPQKSIEILKKLESFLENKIIDIKTNINKKFIIIILHNIACCYHKLKDYDNCINYLESVIYHFDKLIEKKHKISINEEYFDSLIKSQNHNYEKKLLGDLILELRFCAKFHLQMSVILSQAKRHVDSIKHAKLAALICEDNLIKTHLLYNQLKETLLNSNNNSENYNNELASIKKQIKLNYKIIVELYKRVLDLRNNKNIKVNKNNIINLNEKKSKKNMKSIYNNNYMYIKNVITKIVKNPSDKIKYDLPYNSFDSYANYRKSEIEHFMRNSTTLNDIKNIFENNFKQKDDWIKLLNIDNIMYLSALNYDDLDLESDPKYELLRDSILEKVIMLTVSYYCLSNEIRTLSKDNNKKNINGEYYLFNAISLSLIFLPVSCPIVNHYIMKYYQFYGQGMDIIPEGEIVDYKIDIIRKEIELGNDEENNNENKNNNIIKKNDSYNKKDFLYFITTKKINRVVNEENNMYFTINSDLFRSKSKSEKNDFNSNECSENYYSLKKSNIDEIKDEKNIGGKHSNHLSYTKVNNKELQIINISDNYIYSKKRFSNKNSNEKYRSNRKRFSISPSSSSDSEYKRDNNNKINNGNFDLIPNNNFIERVKKSKISENKAPKFKLNFNNINTNIDNIDIHNSHNNTGNMTTGTYIIKQLSTDKRTKKEKNRKMINSAKKKGISKKNKKSKDYNKTPINIQLNNNFISNKKTNINIKKIEKNQNNDKLSIKNFNKVNIQKLGSKTERLYLKETNSNIKKKIICKKKSNDSNKYINSKKLNNSIYVDNFININNISKYFNIKGSNSLEKGFLTERFIVKINNRLKEIGIKMKKNVTHNSNSPFLRKDANNQIYNNYIKKKKKDKNPKNPIKLMNGNKNDMAKSVLSDHQKNNLSNGINNSNIINFISNDSNNEDFSLGSKKIYKRGYKKLEKDNINNKYKNERINKYLKNINLIKKLINNKNAVNDKTFNKEMNMNNQTKFYQALKKMNIVPNTKDRINIINVKNPKQNKLQMNKK